LDLLSKFNTQSIIMGSKGRGEEAQQLRKEVLQVMLELVEQAVAQAQEHVLLLIHKPEETTYSPGMLARQLERLERTIKKSPAVCSQARKRIIEGVQLESKDKQLSLHETDIQVILRGKAGKAVEFGNALWLVETECGYIVDHDLIKEHSADSKYVAGSIERLVGLELPVKSYCADRGAQSAANEQLLKQHGIENYICPKGAAMAKRLKEDPKLGAALKRRASTEARIAILTNQFLGEPARAKGFEHRKLAVGWAVLTHNLWVLARLPEREEEATTTALPVEQQRPRELRAAA
jgi:hypothetical protein